MDTSSLSLGIAVEVEGYFIKDASWLHRDIANHISMVELDAVIKGLNLILAWGLKKVELMIDSSTVYG